MPLPMSRIEDTKMKSAGISAFLKAEVEPRHGEIILFACCLSSGLVDSTIYNAYRTFVSMQTGNTIFVGLGASGQDSRPYGWVGSLTAIGCFIIGSFLFAWLHRLLGARRRGSLMLSFLIQALVIILTAGLVQGKVISSELVGSVDRPTGTPPWNQEVPIVLLSIQSAGQIVASRTLGFNEIPTVVITSLLCDLMSDPKLFLLRNEKRDRRIIAFVLTLIGAIIGGWVTKATQQIAPVLWISAGIKFALAGAWGFWTSA